MVISGHASEVARFRQRLLFTYGFSGKVQDYRRQAIKNGVEQGHGTQSNRLGMKDLWPSASRFWGTISRHIICSGQLFAQFFRSHPEELPEAQRGQLQAQQAVRRLILSVPGPELV